MLGSEFDGEKLREARRFNSKSITELADELGVSKQMVSKYENGKAKPNYEAIFTLVKFLGFPREFYFTKRNYQLASNGTFFRSRLTSLQKEKEPMEYVKQYAAVVRDFLGEYLEFPVLDENIRGTLNTANEYAEFIRTFWRLGDNPIQNVMRLLEEKGFVVSNIKRNTTKVDAFGSQVEINSNKYYIIMTEGTKTSFYRQQFSLAHELGHWLMHSEVDPQNLDKDEYKKMEQEANEFASQFLLPASAFMKDIRTNPLDLEYYISLKKKWNVSIAMMIMRTKALGLISGEDYTRLQRQISYRKWRTAEPLDEIKEIARPIALRQAIELLVENNYFKGHDIPLELVHRYGEALPIDLLEEITDVKTGYLKYEDPQIVMLRK